MKRGKVGLHYNSKEDTLELWVKGNEEKTWGFCIGTKYRFPQVGERDLNDKEPLYIRNEIINQMTAWVEINQYEFIGYIRDENFPYEEEEE